MPVLGAHDDGSKEWSASLGDAHLAGAGWLGRSWSWHRAGGDDHHPAWFLNLRDNPNVDVVTSGKPKQRMRARVATPEERARLWPLVIADHENYAGYQKKTRREIPLVLLEPVT